MFLRTHKHMAIPKLYTEYCSWCRMVFYVTAATILVTLRMYEDSQVLPLQLIVSSSNWFQLLIETKLVQSPHQSVTKQCRCG